MFSAIAACGIWPALPLTGYWLFARPHLSRAKGEFPVVTNFCLMSVAGIAVWSVPMLGSAVARVYRAEFFGVLGWAITLWSLRRLLKRRVFARRAGFGLTGWDWVLVAGWLLAAGLYLGFPQESIYGGSDEGIYANHGVYIAHHGKLDISYPWSTSSEPILSPGFKGYDGFYTTKPTMTAQFGHLFPVWLAQAFSTFGQYGLFRLNGMFALLFLGIFYGFCRFAMPKSYAVVATLFLGLNVSQIWAARITISEVFAQLFIWAALLLILRALETHDNAMMRWSGVFLGVSALARIDGFFFVPLLLLSHLGHKSIEGPVAKRSSPIWYCLYQTALPTFLLALGYYFFFSAPYFEWISPHLEKTGIATLIALFALLTTTPRVLRIVHPWLIGRAVLVLVGLALIALTVYGYWIGPHRLPYALIRRPWHLLHLTREYRGNPLANLARYLSLPVVSIAIFGWFVALRSMLRRRHGPQLVAVLVVVAGFSMLYLSNPHVMPVHFWAIRRFVPVIIPGFVFFAFAGGWRILRELPSGWVSPAAQLIVAFLTVLTLRVGSLIFAFAENKGVFQQLEELAKKLPTDELILADGADATWTDPLYLSFDRKVIRIGLGSDEGKNTFKSWVAKQTKEQRPVYLLFEGRLRQPGFQRVALDEMALSWFYSERTPEPLPRKILNERRTISLYKITGVTEYSDYQNVPLGAEMMGGVEESGFHGQEWIGNKPVRWTKGEAKLIVPLDEQHPPRAFRIDLASTGPKGTRLQVSVNGHKLFNGQTPAGEWSKTFRLSGLPIEQRTTIELFSDTFVPREVMGSTDARTLGVFVQLIMFLKSDKPISGGPLSAKGYRSQLHLIKKERQYAVASGHTTPLGVTVRNIGQDPWPVLTDLGQQTGNVNLGILWFAQDHTEKRLAEHRAELPYIVFPGNEVDIELALNPLGYDGKRLPPGKYEVWIGLVQEHIAWFYDKGDAVLKLNIDVRP